MVSQYKILFVEDEEALLEMYRMKLDAEGFEVYVALNGEIGLMIAQKCCPHLILLDIIMPKVDGFQMLKRLKSTRITKGIPVIIFSNLSQQEEIKKGFKLGAEDFIVKTSVTPSLLCERIKSFLEERYRS